jgi:cytochrome c oxidase subunit 4
MSREADKPRITAAHLWRRNLAIWAALMGLLVLTLVLAYLPLGALNTPLGIAIGLAKAALVALLFMELARSSALTRLAAMAGLVFMTVLFALTLADVLSRYIGR